MKELDIRKLFLILQNTYSSFQQDDDKVAIWTDILWDTPFEQAQVNLRRYILDPRNLYPPHPGVLAEKPLQRANGPYVPNVEETRRMLLASDQARLTSVPAPESFREAVRKLGEPKG